MRYRFRLLRVVLPIGMIIGASCTQSGAPVSVDGESALLPDGPPSAVFAAHPIGDPMRSSERPRVAHVQIVDLDKDGLADVVVCDALRDTVGWIRQSPKGVFTETTIASIAAPSP